MYGTTMDASRQWAREDSFAHKLYVIGKEGMVKSWPYEHDVLDKLVEVNRGNYFAAMYASDNKTKENEVLIKYGGREITFDIATGMHVEGRKYNIDLPDADVTYVENGTIGTITFVRKKDNAKGDVNAYDMIRALKNIKAMQDVRKASEIDDEDDEDGK